MEGQSIKRVVESVPQASSAHACSAEPRRKPCSRSDHHPHQYAARFPAFTRLSSAILRYDRNFTATSVLEFWDYNMDDGREYSAPKLSTPQEDNNPPRRLSLTSIMGTGRSARKTVNSYATNQPVPTVKLSGAQDLSPRKVSFKDASVETYGVSTIRRNDGLEEEPWASKTGLSLGVSPLLSNCLCYTN